MVTAVDHRVAAGIAPGMPLADARAIDPGLVVIPADPARDRAALARLAAWCGRYSPWTAPDGPDGIWLDITGAAHLRGGEAALVRDIVARLAAQGLWARAALADTPGAAWAVARAGAAPGTVVPPGETRAALARLPVWALRLPAETVELLDRLGLRRIGDLYPLPRPALVLRFGFSIAERLDQALGALPEPLSPLPPAPLRWSHRRFAEPIARPEDLALAIEGLAASLCSRLAAQGMGARRLLLRFYRVDGAVLRLEAGTAQPSREPRHLARLFLERLDTIEPDLGIEDMRLEASVAEPLEARQIELSGALGSSDASGDTKDALAALVDRLENRLGPGAVAAFQPYDSHLPERAVRRAPVFAAAKRAASWNSERRRPVRLLARPEPIEAVAPVPDDPPLLFRWRRLVHRVRAADGPERILGEWWRSATAQAALRDYYCVEDTDGRRFWLFRAGLHRPQEAPRWFMHGFFA